MSKQICFDQSLKKADKHVRHIFAPSKLEHDVMTQYIY